MNDDLMRQRLFAGERILWSGRPSRGLLFTRQDVFLIPFSLVWFSLALSSAAGGSDGDIRSVDTLWHAVFIGLGLYIVGGRFLVDIWLRRATRYAVTDRRALIARSGPFRRFIAVGLHPLPEIALDEGRNGRGTIRLGPEASGWNDRGFGGWSPALDATPKFLAIEEPQRVFDLIQRSAAS